MRRLALLSAISLSLVSASARADDDPDRRERALEQRERAQAEREQAWEQRELRDDRRDLARIESQVARLETMRTSRPPNWAVDALDADVQRELESERLEGRAELRRDEQEVRRGRSDLDAGRREVYSERLQRDGQGFDEARHARGEDRRDLADGVRDRRDEAAQGQRLQQLRRDWAAQRGHYGRPGLERRRVLLDQFMTMARQELAGDRQARREDRR